MGQPENKIRIGTSGWHYDHWIGRFYPEDLDKSRWLGFFARTFDTVEINNTFYRLPSEATVEKWRNDSPEKFLFTVKASRYITHIKRLKDTTESLAIFYGRISLLKEKLSSVLYQLPPNFRKDLDRLEAFLKSLPPKPLSVFEFRNKTWFSNDTYDMLNRYGCAFCIHDLGVSPTPRITTGDSIYIRLHGAAAGDGNYSDEELSQWAGWVASRLANAKMIYTYFNNDFNANAVNNAKTLKVKIGKHMPAEIYT